MKPLPYENEVQEGEQENTSTLEAGVAQSLLGGRDLLIAEVEGRTSASSTNETFDLRLRFEV